jgi:acyl carrier protein
MTLDETKQKVFAAIQSLLEEDKGVVVVGETKLIGDGRVMTSLKLVELCLELEDLATEIGFVFDWTSEAAMSKSRSMFRTAGALAEEFYAQMVVNP